MDKEDEEKKSETICQTTNSGTTIPDREERELIEISMNTKLETTMTTTTKNSGSEEMTEDTPDSPVSPIPMILGLERPTSLAFNKTETSNIDTINCLSPVSPQQVMN